MLKHRLPLALALLIDFIDADFLVPGRDGQMVAHGRE